MIHSTLRDPIENGVSAHRSPEVAVDRGSFQMREVPALQRPDDIGGGVYELGIDPLHSLPMSSLTKSIAR